MELVQGRKEDKVVCQVELVSGPQLRLLETLLTRPTRRDSKS